VTILLESAASVASSVSVATVPSDRTRASPMKALSVEELPNRDRSKASLASQDHRPSDLSSILSNDDAPFALDPAAAALRPQREGAVMESASKSAAHKRVPHQNSKTPTKDFTSDSDSERSSSVFRMIHTDP
jgi:hypothetical protein